MSSSVTTDTGYWRDSVKDNFGAGGVSNFGPILATSSVTKVGVNNPGWKQAIREARNAATPYSVSAVNDGLFTGSFGGVVTIGSTIITESRSGACLVNPRPAPPAILGTFNLDGQARIKFLQACRGARSSFQGGQFLGELKETIHMIRSPASALRREITRYSRAAEKATRGIRNAKSISKAVAGTWLEHSYGWRPLLADVDDAVKTLARIPPVIGTPISVSLRDEYFSGLSVIGNVISHTKCETGFRTRYRSFVRYKGLVGYACDTSAAGSWTSQWGLTLDNFIPTVYELIPYSFLVDYFSNLGSLIDAASFGTVSLRWGVCSTVSSSEFVLGFHRVVQQGSGVFSNPKVALSAPKLSRYSFTRVPISSVSVGITDFQLKVPGVDDWRKWANVGALLLDKVL